MASGVVVGAQRLTTLPSLSMRNFSKFHYRKSFKSVRSKPGCHKEKEADLDTSKPENACLLCLEVLEDLVRVVTVHVRLLHKREGNTMVELAELRDLLVRAWLLAIELVSLKHCISESSG